MAYPLNISQDRKQKKFDIDLCLICQEKNKSPLVNKPKPESLDRIREASISRKDDILKIVDGLSSEILVFKWHRHCYASYVSSHNISRKVERDVLEQNEECYEEGSIPSCSNSSLLTRSFIPKCDYKKCIICQQDTKKKTKTTFRISEVERAKRLLGLCRERQDDVFVRLSTLNDTNDVFAADILYHKLCLDTYFKKSKEAAKSEQPTLNEITQPNVIPASQTCVSATIDNVFALLILEIDDDLKTNCFELSNLTNRLKRLSNTVNITIDNRLVKKLLIEHYGDELVFSQPKNQSKSPIVFKATTKPTDLVESIRNIYEKSLNPDTLKEDLKSNAFNMKGYVCNDALISEEFDNFKLTSQWESFIRKLIGSERYFNTDIKRKCFSIYMDLYYLVTDGDLTPKHVSLAQYIHHYTRSKLLINTLNKLGHCISYPSLKKVDSQAVVDMITKNKTETVPLPSNIINNPSIFLHGAVDNDDFAEETLDGKKTTHVTAMVLYQTATDPCNSESQIERTPVPKDSNFKNNQLIPCQVIKKCFGIKKKPEHYPEQIEIDTPTEEHFSMINNVSDLVWIICRMEHGSADIDSTLPSYALCPGWTPFNQLISKSTMPTTNIGYCTLLPAPPTTTDAVYTVMKNFMSINEHVGRKYSVLSCDMAIYLVAKLIQVQRNEFDTLFLRIGAFHLAKNWLGVIGQFVNDSGFSDIFIETEVYGENTLKAVLKGVHYNRGVRSHKLMYEACRRLQMKVFLKEADDSSMLQLKSQIKNLQEALMSSEEDVPAIYDIIEHDGTNLFSEFAKFLQKKSSENATFKYWCNYCEMVEILLDCIRAERDGNWDLHLRTVKKMIPYLILYNHVNYVRGCVLYLSDMAKLPPELTTAFQQGHFSVKRKAGKFNNVATDHALEQSLIRSSKFQGGLIGITSNQNAMQNWCLLYHFKTGICQALQEFCDIYQDPTNDIDEHSHKEWRIE